MSVKSENGKREAGSEYRKPGIPGGRAALVVAHPGHELRVHGWLGLSRPHVLVMTDGSGHSGRSRLASTSRVLDEAGAAPGSIYGRFSDAAIYKAMISHDFGLFTALAEELAAILIREQVDYVVGDAIEGYNSVHDVCRYLINAAVAMAQRMTGRQLGNFDFLLVGRPDICPQELRNRAVWLRLNDRVFKHKLVVARAYSEIASDVQSALREMGDDAFRTECLRPVAPDSTGIERLDEPPFYERYGEKQVAAGYYDCVLRYREHIIPLIEALESHRTRIG